MTGAQWNKLRTAINVIMILKCLPGRMQCSYSPCNCFIVTTHPFPSTDISTFRILHDISTFRILQVSITCAIAKTRA